MGEENKLLNRDKFNALQNQAYTFSSTVERQSPKLLDLGSNPRGYANQNRKQVYIIFMYLHSSLMTSNKKNMGSGIKVEKLRIYSPRCLRRIGKQTYAVF